MVTDKNNQQTDVTKDLIKLIDASEDWLLERIVFYAKRQGYTRYSSTLKEAWRMSVRGLSDSLIMTLKSGDRSLELRPEESFAGDYSASFGTNEAMKHRRRGISLSMFLGLFKYYRQSYLDLINKTGFSQKREKEYRLYLARFFDRIEIAFCTEWTSLKGSELLEELQQSNKDLTNKKNKYLTSFESLPNPAIILDEQNRVVDINNAAVNVFSDTDEKEANYYGQGHSFETIPWLAEELKHFSQSGKAEIVFEKELKLDDVSFYFEVKFTRMKDISEKFLGTVVIINDLTERKKAKQVLEEQREWLHVTLSSIGDAVIATDTEGKVTFMNEVSEKLTGYTLDEYQGQPIADVFNIINEDSRLPAEIPVERVLKHGMVVGLANHTVLIAKDGVEWPIDDSAAPIMGKAGDILGVVMVFHDITARRQTEEKIKWRLKFEKIITGISTNFIKLPLDALDAGINKALAEIGEFMGVDRSYIFLFSDYGTRMHNIHEWCAEGIEPQIDILSNIQTAGLPYIIETLMNSNSIHIPKVADLPARAEKEKEHLQIQGIQSMTAVPMQLEDKVIGFLGFDSVRTEKTWEEDTFTLLKIVGEIFVNALERKKTEQKLHYISLHDPLTGLHNRVYFERKMANGACPVNTAMVVCDLDGLKLVNDTMGHDVGDKLLVSAANLLNEFFGEEDFLARIGGDEFAVILNNASAATVQEALHGVREAIDKYNEENLRLPLSISIGYARNNQGTETMLDLYKEADNNMYREKLHRSRSTRSTVVLTLMKLLEERDYITEGHGDRLQDFIVAVAERIGVAEYYLADLRLFAKFHDIGKVGISDRILFKAAPLETREYEQMKRHCEIGQRIALSSPDLAVISDWILKHHEWWNGSGYPLGLKGEDIPLSCRILAVVDAYDAMTNDRPYRKALSCEKAVNELRSCAGTQFDPNVTETFLSVLSEAEII